MAASALHCDPAGAHSSDANCADLFRKKEWISQHGCSVSTAVSARPCRQEEAVDCSCPHKPFHCSVFSLQKLRNLRCIHLDHSTLGQNANTEGAMKFLASALLALVLVPVESALGQQQTWDKLTQLSPGTKIEVDDAQFGTIQGQLVSIDEQGLTLRRKGKESGVTETIARADVVRLRCRCTRRRIPLQRADGLQLRPRRNLPKSEWLLFQRHWRRT